MRIQLNESEVTRAIVDYLKTQGLGIAGEVRVDFSMGRSPSVLKAEVTFGEDLEDGTEETPEAPAAASASVDEGEETAEDTDPLFDDD